MNIRLQSVTKSYQVGRASLSVLRQVDLLVAAGDWITITGASGSGKTTLLRCLAGVTRPDTGGISVGELDMMRATEEEIRTFRRKRLGFIFQDFKLFEQFDVLTNVMIPLLPYEKKEIVQKKAMQALERVGLLDRQHHKPHQLSGGEMQRTAIARALMNDPALLLCDEPTGNLDTASRNQVMDLLKGLHGQGTTIVLVTHDTELATYGDKQYGMKDGRMVGKIKG